VSWNKGPAVDKQAGCGDFCLTNLKNIQNRQHSLPTVPADKLSVSRSLIITNKDRRVYPRVKCDEKYEYRQDYLKYPCSGPEALVSCDALDVCSDIPYSLFRWSSLLKYLQSLQTKVSLLNLAQGKFLPLLYLFKRKRSTNSIICLDPVISAAGTVLLDEHRCQHV